MSDSLQVFVKRDLIPKIEEVILELQKQGLELEDWHDISSLAAIDGFWPGKYKGEDAGFEFCVDEVDDDDLNDWGVKRKQLAGRDVMMNICFYTEKDLVAAVLFISFICESFNGITFDEDDSLTVTAVNLTSWKKDMLGDLL